jgi:hypothetical protein
MPDSLSEREVNRILVALESVARGAGYSRRNAEDISGAACRASLQKTGRADKHPEVFEEERVIEWAGLALRSRPPSEG